MQEIAGHPENAGVLAYYARSGRGSEVPVVAAPDAIEDPYLHAGSHPEVVERLWDQLAPETPGALRCLLRGSPAVAHAANGIVLAAALGTSYALRLEPASLREALEAGAETRHRFQTAQVALDLPSTFGEGWVFGTWSEHERRWWSAAYAYFGSGC